MCTITFITEVSITIDPEATPGLDELVELITTMETATAALALQAARVEAGQAWAFDGATSMKAFLQHRCRMTPGDAGALLLHGRFLNRYQAIADASLSSVLSRGQVRTIQVHCPKPIAEFLDEHQTEVVATIAQLRVDHAEVCMTRWRACAEAILDQPEPVEKPRTLGRCRRHETSAAAPCRRPRGRVRAFQQTPRRR